MFTVAEVGMNREVAYVWQRPGETGPLQQSAFVTKVSDLICAVR